MNPRYEPIPERIVGQPGADRPALVPLPDQNAGHIHGPGVRITQPEIGV